ARDQKSKYIIDNNLSDLDSRMQNATKKLSDLEARQEELWTQLKKLLTAAVNPAAASPVAAANLPSAGPVAVNNTDLIASHLVKVTRPGDQIPLSDDPVKFKNYIAQGNETIDHEMSVIGLLPDAAYPEYQNDKVKLNQLATLIDELETGGLGDHHPRLIS